MPMKRTLGNDFSESAIDFGSSQNIYIKAEASMVIMCYTLRIYRVAQKKYSSLILYITEKLG